MSKQVANRVTCKKEGLGAQGIGPAGKPTFVWRVYVDRKKSGMLISFDRTMNDWDLSGGGHIMSAHSKGSLMRRLEDLIASLEGAQ